MVRRRATHELQGGAVLLVPPGVEHGAVVGRFEPSQLAWLQADLRQVETAGPLLARFDATGSAGTPPKLRSAWREPAFKPLCALHAELWHECRHPRPDSPALMRGLFTALIAYIARHACEPIDPDPDDLPAPLRTLLHHLDANLDRRVDLRELCNVAGLSRTRVHALFREHLGQSPGAVAVQRRLKHAQHLLRETERTITDIALELGFSSSQHFATAFRNRFGIRPSEYRRGLE